MLNSMYSKKKLKLSISNINIIIYIYNLVGHPRDSGELKIDMIFNFFFHEENEEENDL